MIQTFLRILRKSICRDKREKIFFSFEAGAVFHPETGFFEKEHMEATEAECADSKVMHPFWMADFRFYEVTAGDKIVCTDSTYQYGIASYSSEIEDRLIYTYCYQEEENWSRYRGDFKWDALHGGRYTLSQDGWIRVAVKRKDGALITPEDVYRASKALYLLREKRTYQKKDYYRQEIEKTVQTVREKREENKRKNSLVFGLITDSHYVINGGWEDSIANLQEVCRETGFDAMIHLGDLTDGMIPLAVTKEYTVRVMRDLETLQVPVYLALGNHDSNYFRGNPEWMSEQEQSKHYLGREKPWYYVDFEKPKLRCLFLHSFNHRENIRYGFPLEEIEWVKNTLLAAPAGYSVLVFAHVPLLPEMHFWSKEIRNSSEMLEVLEEYVAQGGRILAYIHGHNHADQIFLERSFPIVSIGCAKCEDFKDKKPEGAVTYDRKMGTATQELWDVMVVDVEEGKIDFVRFGAGEDRRVCAGAQFFV